MAQEDVEYRITAKDDSARGVDSARRKFEQLDRDTKRIGKSLGKDLIGNGTAIGALFGENIAKGLSRAAPALAPVLAGVAIASAPVIGATIGAAVIGGAAGVGIIGGVILASRDPRVKAAGSTLGNSLLNRLETRAAVFVNPVLASIAKIDKGFDGVGDNISRIFANTARFVAPLTAGAIAAFQRITQGIDKLTGAAGPVIDVLSQGIANLGNAVGDVFESLADDGVSAATALNQVFQVLEFTIRGVGLAINALTETYGFLAKVGAFGRDAQLEYVRLEANAKIAATANQSLGTSFGTVRAAGESVASTMRTVIAATANLTESNRSLYSSQTSAAEAIARTKDAIKENGRTLDLNTEKGRANRQALSNLASALNSQYEATLKASGAGRVANGVAASNRAAFIRLATQLTGSASKARQLANQLLGIPNVTRKVTINGVEAAKRAAAVIRQTLAAIKDETVNVYYKTSGISSAEARAAAEKNSARFTASEYFAANPGGNAGVPAVNVAAPQLEVFVSVDGRQLDARIDTKIRRNNNSQNIKALGRSY